MDESACARVVGRVECIIGIHGTFFRYHCTTGMMVDRGCECIECICDGV